MKTLSIPFKELRLDVIEKTIVNISNLKKVDIESDSKERDLLYQHYDILESLLNNKEAIHVFNNSSYFATICHEIKLKTDNKLERLFRKFLSNFYISRERKKWVIHDSNFFNSVVWIGLLQLETRMPVISTNETKIFLRYQTLIDICIALASLELPAYVVEEIITWIAPLECFTHMARIKICINVKNFYRKKLLKNKQQSAT